MGNNQSTNQGSVSQQLQNGNGNGIANVNANINANPLMNDILNYVYLSSENQEPVVFFVKDLTADPCALLGRHLIDVANELKRDGAVAFAVGVGPCPECNVPSFYWWSGREWQNSSIPTLDTFRTAVDNYVIAKNLQGAYHLMADKDLKVTKIVRSVRRNGQQLQLADNCNRTLSPNQVNGLPVTSSYQELVVVPTQPASTGLPWWAWLLILLALALLLWFLFRPKEEDKYRVDRRLY